MTPLNSVAKRRKLKSSRTVVRYGPAVSYGFTIDTAMPKALFCPTCRNVVLIDNENFPFCSDRCRMLDLGKWASGDYKISSPIQDPDLLEELARSERNKPTDDES
jgi:endogenous inhibitor of DNA gyrase (YacG/DUF329 family)